MVAPLLAVAVVVLTIMNLGLLFQLFLIIHNDFVKAGICTTVVVGLVAFGIYGITNFLAYAILSASLGL